MAATIDYAEKQLTYSTGMIAFQGGPVNPEVVRLLRDHIDE